MVIACDKDAIYRPLEITVIETVAGSLGEESEDVKMSVASGYQCVAHSIRYPIFTRDAPTSHIMTVILLESPS